MAVHLPGQQQEWGESPLAKCSSPITPWCAVQVLEKKEVKRWKKALREVSGLTLCGKRIQQYCDTNKDKRLSQKEWTKCLDVAMGMISQTINIYMYCIYQITKTTLLSRRL